MNTPSAPFDATPAPFDPTPAPFDATPAPFDPAAAPFDATPEASDATAESTDTTEPTPVDNAVRIGARLRRIRNQQGLSLADVQERSNGVWKAVVVGAYERGDRAVTVTRLSGLAEFYGVPLADLLPDPIGHEERSALPSDRVTLDLTRLDVRDPELSAVARFADHVRGRRGDHNGRVMTLRGGDVETIAMAVGQPLDAVLRPLAAAGVLVRLDVTGRPALRSTGRSPLPRSDAPTPESVKATPRFPPASTVDLQTRASRQTAPQRTVSRAAPAAR